MDYQAEVRRGGLSLLHRRTGAREIDHPDPGSPGRCLLEALELFADQVGYQKRCPRDVPSGVREARYEPGSQRVANRCHHERNTRRRSSRRTGGIGSERDDDVNLLLDELCCERSELVAPPGRVARLETNVLALVPAHFAKPLADGGNAVEAKLWCEETE